MPFPRRTMFPAAPLFGLAVLAASCSSGTNGELALTGGNEVATLEDTIVASVVEEDGEDADADVSPEDAALAFSQCMRDEGLDFPDLAVDAEGNIDIRSGFEGIDRNDESFRIARQACQDELAAGGFGGGRREALESPEVQDGLVAFSDCVRDQGFDVGDLTLGQGNGPGGGQAAGQGNGADQGDGAADDEAGADDEAAATGEGPGEGRRQGGFGNRNDRLAQQLGLDPEDPAVADALETCSPILEEAFAAVGVGPANNGNNGG